MKKAGTGEFEIILDTHSGVSGDLTVIDKVTGVQGTTLIDLNCWFFNWRLKRKTKKLKNTLLILRGEHL